MKLHDWKETPPGSYWFNLSLFDKAGRKICPELPYWYQEWWTVGGSVFAPVYSARCYPSGVLDGLVCLYCMQTFTEWEVPDADT